jgi:hypothetical protein
MIEQNYIDRIYKTLGEMDVELDSDPIAFGPSRLNQKTSEVRGFLSRTEKIFMEVSHNLQKIKRDLLVSQTEYKIEQDSLIANDPHVRSGRSQKEREALAATRLIHIQRKINEFTLSVHDLEDLMSVIKAKRTDLKDLQGRLRDQLKLCQEQIALGQRWGSRTYTANTFEGTTVSNPSVTTESLVEDFTRERESVETQLNDAASKELEAALNRPPVKTDVLTDTIEGVNNVITQFEKTPLQEVNTDVDDLDLDDLFSQFGT